MRTDADPEIDHDREQDADNEARDDAGDQELADGGLGRDAVDHHGDAGRESGYRASRRCRSRRRRVRRNSPWRRISGMAILDITEAAAVLAPDMAPKMPQAKTVAIAEAALDMRAATLLAAV